MAILENGRPLAVLAGWSDSDRGMPGYSRDVIGQTPFGWSLDDAMEGFAARLERSRSFWRWRPTGWSQFQQALLGHLQARLGPAGHYWDASAGKQPLIGVTERPPVPGRPYTVLSTVGMSGQRMPVVEQVLDDSSGYARIELAVATTLPSAQAARVFLWLATYPWNAVTWFGPGHSVRWYHEPATFPLGGGAEAVLLLDPPGALSEGGRAGGRPGRAAATGPVGVHLRRGSGALAVDHPDLRAGTAAGPRPRLGRAGQQALGPAPELGGWALGPPGGE